MRPTWRRLFDKSDDAARPRKCPRAWRWCMGVLGTLAAAVAARFRRFSLVSGAHECHCFRRKSPALARALTSAAIYTVCECGCRIDRRGLDRWTQQCCRARQPSCWAASTDAALIDGHAIQACLGGPTLAAAFFIGQVTHNVDLTIPHLYISYSHELYDYRRAGYVKDGYG